MNRLPYPYSKHAIKAWDRAVDWIVPIYEDLYLSRSGTHGQERQKASLAVAAFDHTTTRARGGPEPQRHRHYVWVNACRKTDGSFTALDTREFLNWVRSLGPILNTQFAYELRRELGVALEPQRDEKGRIRPATVSGVPKELVEHWSSRSRELKEALSISGQRGDLWRENFSAQARALAAQLIREPKKEVPPQKVLLAEWARTATEFGYTSENAVALCGKAKPIRLPREYRAAWKEALKALTRNDTRFTKRELIREICERIQHHGADLGKLLPRIDRDLSRSRSIVTLGERDRETVYTTKAVLRQERALEKEFQKLLKTPGATVPANILDPILQKHGFLSPEQSAAVTFLATKPASVRPLVGVAGSGKTTALSVLRQAFEASDFKVVGAAIAGIAAEELSSKANIPSRTIASYMWKIDDGLKSRVKRAVRREWAKILKAFGRERPESLRTLFDKKTVLVIDEAGMLHTKATLKLIRHVRECGATVILCGDPSQLQPIEAGAPFARLLKQTACAELLTNRRQKDALDRVAAAAVREGEVAAAVTNFKERGRIKVSETREGAMNALVRAWVKAGGLDHPSENLIYADMRSDVQAINDRCQKQASMKRVTPGKWIKLSRQAVVDGRNFNEGDYVRFSAPIYEYGILNGYRGKVVSIGGLPSNRTISVRLDPKHSPRKPTGRLVTIPLSALTRDNFCLGYASTISSGQGSDTTTAFVLVGSRMTSQQTFYTTITRGKAATKIFVDKLHAGEELRDLHRQVARSRKKEMALDVLDSGRAAPEFSREIDRSRKS
jgi:conjugative relaxase-like TrwC/TraI family protein